MKKQETEQITILDEIDQRNKMTQRMQLAEIREKLKNEYVSARDKFSCNVDNLPDGLVVIAEVTKYETTGQQRHFYRCVIGHHRTVSGLMAHIISEPDEEWPDEPSWQYDKQNKCKWIYPVMQMWCKKEPEKEECEWTEGWIK